jgi:drug/metabolite transporter (DMT)-like permease
VIIITGGPNAFSFGDLGELRNIGKGDALVILSSFFYSLHVVRLGRYANESSAVKLAVSKAASELILSTVAIAVSTFFLHSNEIPTYIHSVIEDSPTIGYEVLFRTLLWNGVFATAFTTWCQSSGQQQIPPTEANLIYTSQPVWAILIAYFALNEKVESTLIPGILLLALSIGISLRIPEERRQ